MRHSQGEGEIPARQAESVSPRSGMSRRGAYETVFDFFLERPGWSLSGLVVDFWGGTSARAAHGKE